MGGQAHQVHTPAHRVAGDLQKALHRIAVQQGAAVFLPQQAGHLLHREDAAGFVVHQHHAHQHRVLPQGLGHLLRRHMAGFVRGQVRHLVPLLLQQLTRLQHGAVLHGGGDDVPPGVAALPHGGGDGPVVRLRAAGGEVQVLRPAPQGPGDNGPALLHQSLGLPAQGILGGGVAELLRQHLIHGVRHGPGHRRGGCVIQINHMRFLTNLRRRLPPAAECYIIRHKVFFIIPNLPEKCKENPHASAIYTLGCKVNQYETQAMEQELRRRGHELVDFEDSADAYIIKTCSVTAVSDKKSRQMIRRAKRRSPNAVVAACGCYVQTHTDEAKTLGIDLIGGTGDRMAFLDLLEQEVRDRTPRVAVDDSLRRRS